MHRLLRRQLKKLGLDPDRSPGLDAWRQFMEGVDRSYTEADQDRYLLERSLTISSQEMQELYDNLKQASESLITAERDRLRALMDNVVDGIITFDRQGMIRSSNPAVEKIFGRPSRSMAGLKIHHLLAEPLPPPAGADGVPGLDLSPFLGIGAETAGLRPDGQPFPLEMAVSQVSLEGEDLYIAILRDISERVAAAQALLESEERFRTIIESTQVFLVKVDTRGYFTYANEAAARALGNEQPRDLIGKLYLRYVHPEDRRRVGETYLEQIDKRIPSTVLEFRGPQRPDGPRWYRFTANLLYEDGQVTGQIGVAQDITDRVVAELALRESEQKFSTLFHQSNDGILIYDLKGSVREVNRKMLEMVAYSQEDVLGNPVDVLHPPSELQAFRQALAEIQQTGFVKFEIDFLDKNGQVFPAEVSSNLVQLGRETLVQAIVRDMTQRKQSEAHIRRHNENLAFFNALNQAVNQNHSLDQILNLMAEETKKLFSGHGVTVYLLGPDRQELEMQNLSLPAEIRDQIEDLIGSKIPQLVFPYQDVTCYARVLEGGRPFRTNEPEDIRRLVGEVAAAARLPLEGVTRPLIAKIVPQITSILGISSLMLVPLQARGELIGLLETSRKEPFSEEDLDRFAVLAGQLTAIILRKRTEDALRESEERFRTLFENAPIGLGVADERGRLVAYNPAMLAPGGYEPEDIEIIERVSDLYYDPQERERVLQIAAREGVVQRHEVRFKRKDGQPYDALLSLTPIHVNGNRFWQAMVEDITNQKRAEGRLRLQASALEAVANAIMITDRQGTITWVNPAFTSLTGYRAEEAIGQTPGLLNSGEHDPAYFKNMWETILAGEVWRGELANRHKDGQIYYEEQTITPVRQADGQISHFIAIKQDISHQVRAKEVLFRRSQQQELLLETARHLTASLEFMEVLTQIGMRAKEILNAFGCAIYLLEEDGRTLTPVVSLEPPYDEEILSTSLDVDTSFTGQAVKERRSLIYNRVTEAQVGQQIPGTPEDHDERIIVAPFVADGQVLGAMCLNRLEEDFTEEDLTLVETYATYATTALKNARTYQELEREMEERVRAEEETQQRNRELALLNRVVAAAASSLEMENLLATVCRELALAFGVPQAAATLLTDDRTSLRVVAEYLEEGRPSALNVIIPIEGNPATQYVLENKSPLAVEDAQHDPSMQAINALMETRGTESLLILPLIVREQVVGTIGLDAIERRSFTPQEIDLAATAASTAAQAIHTARLFDETLRRAEELEAVTDVSLALRTAASRQEMFPIILNQLLYLLEADGAAIALRDPASQGSVVELARGAWAPFTGQKLQPGQGVIGRVTATMQPYVRGGRSSRDESVPDELVGSLPSVACVPLIAQEHAIGALLVGRQQDLNKDELRLLHGICDMVANAIYRESLREQTERRVRRLAALRTIDEAITASVDLRLTLRILLEQVATQLDVDATAVLLLTPHTQSLELSARRGFRAETMRHVQLRLGEGNAGKAALQRRVVHVPDLATAEDATPRERMLVQEGFLTYYAVPLIAKGQVKGVLEIFNKKPLEPDPEWVDFLETLAGQAAIAIDNVGLFDDLQRSNIELTLAYDATIEGWAHALEMRDMETQGHSQRVTDLTLRLAQAMGVAEGELEHIRRGALLHDIGKMGIPDRILHKPGPLTEEEWEVMRRHPTYAFDLLSPIPYLRPALDIPYCHHEKWDGSGYPRGLAGEAIPLSARIFAVVDVWDALRSDRPYRPAWSEEDALRYIQEERGSHFDPQVVNIFLKQIGEQVRVQLPKPPGD